MSQSYISFTQVLYRCTKGEHVSYLRVTKQQPDQNRWQDSACGYCLREGVTDSLMKRV